MQNKKPKVLIITGATAIGKSDLAISLAKEFNAEIISADSMQIYKGLDIGTGKVTANQMQGIAHHMLDIISPSDSYSVSQYKLDAFKIIDRIHAKNKNVVVVGGTGLYLNALTLGFNLADAKPNIELRTKYTQILELHGHEYLHKMLEKVDPLAASKIAINDSKRVIRALEIFEQTGQTKDSRINNSQENKYDMQMLVLTKPRDELYAKINARVDSMLKAGLEEEVKKFTEYKDCQSMKAIGYKEFIDYFDGVIDYSTAIDKIKQHSRNYAKRQITFFKWLKFEPKHFVEVGDTKKIKDLTKDFFT